MTFLVPLDGPKISTPCCPKSKSKLWKNISVYGNVVYEGYEDVMKTISPSYIVKVVMDALED